MRIMYSGDNNRAPKTCLPLEFSLRMQQTGMKVADVKLYKKTEFTYL